MKKRKKLIFGLFFSFLLFFQSGKKVEAIAPWSNVYVDLAIHFHAELMIELRISANASAKLFSIKQAQATIQSMLNNSSSQPKFITRYDDFLIKNPQIKAGEATKTHLNFLLQGRVGGGYVRANAEVNEEGIDLAYSDILYQSGMAFLENDKEYADYMDYCPDLAKEDMFASGNLECFNYLMSHPLENTPWGVSINAQTTYNEYLRQNERVAEGVVQASDGGFLPIIDESGNVVLPSKINAELQLEITMMPINALENSDSAVFSSMIQAWANSTITKVFNSGLGENSAKAKNNYMEFSAKFLGAFGSNLNPLVSNGRKTIWDQ